MPRLQHTASTQPSESTRQYLTPYQAVAVTGLSLSTVWRYIRSGKLPVYQPGGPRCRVMIPREALQGIVASVETACRTAPARKRSGPRARWKK
ncbi:helix-turn-helix domain-containing protein [Lacipirellula sp.]|uniref:helix-turn-helix domain-containing protein n=1 Tax=Lacipirellula sp. TaxID=2691419 RepID=UPI003D0D8014